MSSLSVIIPCQNEELAIPQVLTRLQQVQTHAQWAQLNIQWLETIVVDDGSTDSSFEVLRRFPNVKVIRHTQAKGYGAALKTGFESSHGQWLAFLDMDNTYDPLDLVRLLEKAQSQEPVMICGDRLSRQSEMPWQRRLGNLLYVVLVRVLFGDTVRDACTGLRVFDRQRADKLSRLPSDHLDYSLHMTLTCLRERWTMLEVPIEYGGRTGSSKLHVLKDGWRFLKTILWHRFQGFEMGSK